ncbi:MAG: ATP-binding cassette domain-containing protein, partial [Gaiellales bacterium]
MSKAVHIRDLAATFGNHRAIDGIDLSFEPGKVTAIIGPSGCGKSTLIRCVNR